MDKKVIAAQELDQLLKDFTGREVRDFIVIWLAGSITERASTYDAALKGVDDIVRPLKAILEHEYASRH